MPIVELVEHVLFLKVKNEIAGETQCEMLKELNALSAINGVLHLKAGPALSLWPGHGTLNGGYTHVLHSRHQDKAALVAFTLHPAQIYTMDKYVNPILADSVLAVDWVASIEKHVDQFFEAKRIVLCKLKEDEPSGLVSQIRETSTSSKFECGGLNFSPVRSKGFNFGYLSFFRKLDEIQQLVNSPELVLSKLKNPNVDNFILVDYTNDTDNNPENSPIAEWQN